MAFIQSSTAQEKLTVCRYTTGLSEVVSLRISNGSGSLCMSVAEAEQLAADLAAVLDKKAEVA